MATVVVHHYAATGSALRDALPWGALGVQLFFVLSGFIITTLFATRYSLDGADRLSVLAAFIVSRVFRIFPLIGLAVAFLALVAFPKPPGFYLYNLTMSGALYSNATGYFAPWTGHFWTLTSEMAFYLCWPVAWLLIPKRHRLTATIVLWALFLALRPAWLEIPGKMPWLLPPMRMDAFLLGALAAQIRPFPRASLAALLALFAGTVFAVLAFRLPNASLPMDSAMNIAFAGLLLGAINWRALGWLANPALSYLGRISFSIYVWHHVLQVLTEPVSSALHWQSNLSWLWLLPLTLALSAVTYAFVEMAFVRLGHQIGDRVRRPSSRTVIEPGAP